MSKSKRDLKTEMLLALKVKERAVSKGLRVASRGQEGEKKKETDSPLSLQKKCSSDDTLILVK